uniref:Putative monolaris n=1 Tax=Rhipicephalus pulchellus TaxID=72859 RepID=L7LSR8_RHIPC
MCKATLVVVLILSSVAPLLAWPPVLPFKWQNWMWTTSARQRGHSERQNYRVIKPSCSGGNGTIMACIYPMLCNCPEPTTGGYMRNTDNIRWFYNNNTHQCQSKKGNPGGCNNFDEKVQCQRHCETPLKQKRLQ